MNIQLMLGKQEIHTEFWVWPCGRWGNERITLTWMLGI